MTDEPNKQVERHIRFVAKHYREGSLDTDKAWKKFASGRGIVRRSSFRRYWLQAAATVLVLVGLGIWYTLERDAPDWVTIVSAPGQLKDVYLSDSTFISLAGGSSVRYDVRKYGKERRVVEMTGKAFFQVTRNEARPFSVHTGVTEVMVLGTSFQVEERPSVTEVNVVTGKVLFTAGENKENVILTVGMSAFYVLAKKEITVVTEEDANKLSWKTGLLRFQDTPLEQVMADLSAYYGVRVLNRTKSQGAKLTATFNNLPLDEVLRVVNQTLDVGLVVMKEKR